MRTPSTPILSIPALLAGLLVACGDDGSTMDTPTSAATTEADPDTTDTAAETGPGTTGTNGTNGTTSVDPDGGSSDDSTGGGDDESGSDSTGDEALEIIGDWIEAYPGGMTTHTITAGSWTQTSDFGTFGYTLGTFDNAAGWVVGQDQGDDTYSRFDWLWDADDELHYCWAAFGEATEQAAIDAPAPDAGDLDTGCSGFPWSHLQPD